MPARGQSGAGLIEVLVGILVMMPMTLAAVSGMQFTTRTSAANEHRQELELTLTTATEDLKAMPYLQCGTPEEYQKLYGEWSAPLTTKLRSEEGVAAPEFTSVSYWARGKGAYAESCGGDDGAQMIVVQVTGDGVTVTGTMVKRDENARVGNSG